LSILAFAYACEPDRGSEPGAGWDWVRVLARLDETVVITRANNAPSIESSLGEIPERNHLSFEYIDLPRWARFWKKGKRGARVYYLVWQFAALAKARRLRSRRDIDLVWHLTVANVWMGSTAPLAGGRLVLGPVGGGVSPPLRLLPTLGIRGTAFELARAVAKSTGRYLNPLARISWRRAELILAQNPETKGWIPRRHRHKAVVFQNALISPSARLHRRSDGQPTLLFAGRILPWKGLYLALKSLKLLPGWRFIICGTGPDQPRLRRLARRWHLHDRVEFRGWVPQSELARIMREDADVFIFPSLHDDSPLAVAEARAIGLPVVCLDRGGPALLASHVVPVRSPVRTARALATEVLRARGSQPAQFVTRDEQLAHLRELLTERGLLSAPTAASGM
jgi:glycosyltransferase involved in cell wall biosynthesis